MRIAVILPAYNEADRIGSVLASLPRAINGHEVIRIVVNDGSQDATSARAREVPGVVVIRHRTNLGKGAAAKTGCEAAIRLKADILVLMDADGQHRSEDIARMVGPLMGGEKDLVIGTRSWTGSMP